MFDKLQVIVWYLSLLWDMKWWEFVGQKKPMGSEVEACYRVTPCFCLSVILFILPRLKRVNVGSKRVMCEPQPLIANNFHHHFSPFPFKGKTTAPHISPSPWSPVVLAAAWHSKHNLVEKTPTPPAPPPGVQVSCGQPKKQVSVYNLNECLKKKVMVGW